MVADGHRVHHLVGDEHDREATALGFVDDAEDMGRLLDAKRGSRLIEDEDAGAEMHSAGDGERLPLAARSPPTRRSPSSIRVMPKSRTALTAISLAFLRS